MLLTNDNPAAAQIQANNSFLPSDLDITQDILENSFSNIDNKTLFDTLM